MALLLDDVNFCYNINEDAHEMLNFKTWRKQTWRFIFVKSNEQTWETRGKTWQFYETDKRWQTMSLSKNLKLAWILLTNVEILCWAKRQNGKQEIGMRKRTEIDDINRWWLWIFNNIILEKRNRALRSSNMLKIHVFSAKCFLFSNLIDINTKLRLANLQSRQKKLSVWGQNVEHLMMI